VEGCPASAREIIGRVMTRTEVMNEVEKDVLFYDESGGGVTISGGEPFFQPAFLGGLLRSLKEKGIHTTVDTCGGVDPEVLFSMTDRIDLFLYDLKHPDEEKHRRFTGVSNREILSNLQRLDREGKAMVIRIPLIPGFNDDTQTVWDMAHMVRALKHPPRVDLLPYHRLAEDKYGRMGRSFLMKDMVPPDNGRIAEAVRVFESFDLETVVGG
jgi:pyruvate formate lyase activating enzyme